MTVNATAPTYVFLSGTYPAGIPVTSASVSYFGCVPCTFSISPSMPAGLTLNTSTGVISGTPTTTQASTTYTITLTNSAGTKTTTSASITIPALTVSYSSLFIAYYAVNSAVNLTPTVSSASTVTYALTTGTLPAGVSLNTTTGAITGTTPAGTSTTSIGITATNSYGSVVSTLSSFRVNTVANMTCNTTGTFAGCGASTPYSCTASSICYGSYSGSSSCVQSAPAGACQF
ncbi:MAG: putative Ig domain-containing protein [Leptospiraceae bacterium]|nr:putative Ig domain-containing protein [Leptospiraceae bacterium]